MASSILVSTKNLFKSYKEGAKERQILAKINLEIMAGELVVLLGRSGSGKSTLLNIISGIDQPSSGEVIINGTDITKLNEEQRTLFRRNNIGFVFQLFNLIPTLTVHENVLLPLELTGKLKKGHRGHVEKLLSTLGLTDRIHSFPDMLSGGEQQRVAILRALIHQPLLLLADEPTGNLDTETSKQVMGLLSALVRKEKKTMILVTHNEEFIKLADRVFVIRDGQIVAQKSRGTQQ